MKYCVFLIYFILDIGTTLITMPPYNSVKSLQTLALEQACKYILSISNKMKKDVNGSREYFINNVHAWARTNILDYTKVLL